MKKILKILFVAILLLVLAVTGIFFYFFRSPLSKAEQERFVVGKETSQVEIIEELQKNGFFRSRTVFDFVQSAVCWQDTRGLIGCSKIEPGAYLLSKQMNTYQLVKTLTGVPYQKWVTIPSGKRKEQVAIILKKALDWPEDKTKEFAQIAKEGYLYADTYLINTDDDAAQTAQRLTSAFNEHFSADLQKLLLSKNIRSDTAIRFASLIERESGSEEDKPIIAAIIWNRLEKEMRLEIDATVQFALVSDELANDQNNLFDEDYSFWPQLGSGFVRTLDSPYNTYLNDGLPPGPICTPTVSSIEAVANPAETDALYYLHSPDRQIHTAKTYKEHLENINKYLN